MAFAQRVRPSGGNGVPGPGPLRLPEAERWPALSEYLTLDRWEDGGERECSSLAVFCQDGALKVCLTDKANKRCCFVAAYGLLDALDLLDDALRADRADWRPWKPFGGKGKGK